MAIVILTALLVNFSSSELLLPVIEFPLEVFSAIHRNSSGLTDDVVTVFFANRLALLLPLIPDCAVTQHNTTLFAQSRLFRSPKHSQTNFDRMC